MGRERRALAMHVPRETNANNNNNSDDNSDSDHAQNEIRGTGPIQSTIQSLSLVQNKSVNRSNLTRARISFLVASPMGGGVS